MLLKNKYYKNDTLTKVRTCKSLQQTHKTLKFCLIGENNKGINCYTISKDVSILDFLNKTIKVH